MLRAFALEIPSDKHSATTGVAVFFTSAMVAHRTLYEARPAARFLTEFYLWMSLGGALGGMFTALVAPQIFKEIYEYPLLLALSMACRPGALSLSRERFKDEVLPLAVIAAVGIAVIYAVPYIGSSTRLPIFRQVSPTMVDEWAKKAGSDGESIVRAMKH